MPAHYAHYRFGATQIARMPADVKKLVQRFRQLYDVGLHGPDIFAYYNPLLHTPAGALEQKIHAQTGREFFKRVCRRQRLDPTEAGRAYLYGVLAHYCLDSVCRPFAKQMAEEKQLDLVEIETEFDRFLLERDGKPHTFDSSRHIRLTPGECDTVARFYPSVTAGQVRTGVRNMALLVRLSATPEGPGRNLVEKGAPLFGSTAKQMFLSKAANPRCAALDGPLLTLYTQAMAQYPAMLEQLQAHLSEGAAFGSEFDLTFG